MAVHAIHHARSGRFVKAYLLTWGLLAAGGLAYLGSLAWQPELSGPSQRPQVAEPDQGLRAATKALAEIGAVRRTVGEMQRDLGQVKETIGQREAQEKATQSRLTALEDRVTTIVVATPAPSPKQKKAAAAAEKTSQKSSEPPQQPTRIISAVEPPAPAVPVITTIAPPPAPAPIETGSIPTMAPITFGDPVVTATKGTSQFAVQLAAGPSLDALKLSWSLLAERHGAVLATLQPRFVPPRNEGGPYRLVAGPLPSRADADKVCADMGVGRTACFSTTFIGEPL